MRNLIILICFLVAGFTSHSQIHDPVKWATSVDKVSDTEFDLLAIATIESGWHLYSQSVPEDGPIQTTFTFEVSDNFELKGNTSEEEGHTVDDLVFQMKIKFFENKATFKQRIKILSENSFNVKGEVEFMVCDDTQCLPPAYIDLNFLIPGKTVATVVSSEEKKEDLQTKETQKKDKSGL